MCNTGQALIVADALIKSLGADADAMVAAKIVELNVWEEPELAAFWRRVNCAVKALVVARQQVNLPWSLTSDHRVNS